MNNIISELFKIIGKYIVIYLVIIFDALIFAYPIMLINNYILSKIYLLPIIDYIDVVAILVLVKIIGLLITINKNSDNSE